MNIRSPIACTNLPNMECNSIFETMFCLDTRRMSSHISVMIDSLTHARTPLLSHLSVPPIQATVDPECPFAYAKPKPSVSQTSTMMAAFISRTFSEPRRAARGSST